MRTERQKALLQQVIDWLAADAPYTKINDKIDLERFNYGDFIDYKVTQTEGTCGTIACIAGAAYLFHRADQLRLQSRGPDCRVISNLEMTSIGAEAVDLLGLHYYQQALLLWPFDVENVDLQFIAPEYYEERESDNTHPLYWTRNLSPKKIAIVLQHFQYTEIINWELAK